MGHLHNHNNLPFFHACHAGGSFKGVRHPLPTGTSLANVMLAVLHAPGMDDLTQFGASEGAFDLDA